MTTLSKKMLGYALGRTVLASDRPLVDEMAAAGGNASFSDLAVKIVTSRQFRNRAGEDVATAAPAPTGTGASTSIRSRCPMSIDHTSVTRHGVISCAAWASRWRCRGWSRCRSSAQAAAAVKANTPPLRLGIVFFSNGVEPIHWWAKGSGAAHGARAGPALPMMPHREDMVFIQGLYNQTAVVSTSPHLGRMNVLSGAPVSLDPSEIRVGTSMDQVLAAQIGSRTAVPSLVLGIEPNELRLEDGLSMIYGSSLSWVSPTKPATKEIYPVAHVRPPGRRRHGPHARPQHPRRGAAGLAEPQAEDQPRRQRQAGRVPRVDPRHREAHRARVEGRAHRRLAADAGAARHAAPGERAAAERARIT